MAFRRDIIVVRVPAVPLVDFYMSVYIGIIRSLLEIVGAFCPLCTLSLSEGAISLREKLHQTISNLINSIKQRNTVKKGAIHVFGTC
jgi:hypothetical protein